MSILQIDYMIIMCIIYSNVVNNNNCGRSQEIFLLKSTLDRRNYLSKERFVGAQIFRVWSNKMFT
jgi:hypothetical protein